MLHPCYLRQYGVYSSVFRRHGNTYLKYQYSYRWELICSMHSMYSSMREIVIIL